MPALSPLSDRLVTLRVPMLAMVLSIAIAGCDRQKGADPQGAAPAAQAAGSASPAGPQRYHVDDSQAGSAMPDAEVITADGSKGRLNAFAGKPVLINLWATWCAPCVEELPTIDALAAEVGDRAHVVTLSQDIGENQAPVKAFLAARNLSHVTVWHDPMNAVGIAYGGALPTTLIYGADGKEVARVSGPLDWQGPEARALLARAGFPTPAR